MTGSKQPESWRSWVGDGMPAAEVELSVPLLRALIAEQAPQWASLPITPFAEGWDNALFRLGEGLLIRMPRRAAAVPLLENEQRVLGHLAPRLPVKIPATVLRGSPAAGYPWPWSVTPFISGKTLDASPLHREGVMQWTRFLLALHQPIDLATDPEPPENSVRGVPLQNRAEDFVQRMAQLNSLGSPLDNRLLELWNRALLAPRHEVATWLHGDPHPRNAIGAGGRLEAVLDWGDVTSGDLASDLASLWMVAHVHEDRTDALAVYLREMCVRFRDLNAAALLHRARGWALVYGVIHLSTGLVDHPTHAAIGAATLSNLLADIRGTTALHERAHS